MFKCHFLVSWCPSCFVMVQKFSMDRVLQCALSGNEPASDWDDGLRVVCLVQSWTQSSAEPLLVPTKAEKTKNWNVSFFLTCRFSCQQPVPINEFCGVARKEHCCGRLLIGQFSSVLWPIKSSWGTWGTIQPRSSSSLFWRKPLWAVPARAEMSTPWYCPSSISSADQGVVHAPRCLEGWFWRGCRDLWHARTMQVSVSWQLPEEVSVDP